jgi:sugar phosphate isomerase/epimerase
MAVQLGTVAPIGFDDFPPGEWLPCLRALGCTVVQVYRNPDAHVTVRQIHDYVAAGQMPCDSLHGVFGEQYDPSSPDEPARRFAVDAYRAEGHLARELGGSLVVVHCSTIRTGGVSAPERAARIAQLRKSIAELARFGRDLGVRYAFENLPAYHAVGSDVGELAAILRDAGCLDNVGMCFDTGHALMVGDAAAAIRAAGDRIIYVHLSDNSGRADEHEMPTYGALDTDAVALALCDVRYSGTVMLEVFASTDRLKQLLDDGCARRLGRILRLANGRDDD